MTFFFKVNNAELFEITQTHYCETACWRYQTYLKFYFFAYFACQHLYFHNKPDAFLLLLATQCLRDVREGGSVQKYSFAFTVVTDGCHFYVVQCVAQCSAVACVREFKICEFQIVRYESVNKVSLYAQNLK